MRKEAVDRFGKNFMESVNRGNINTSGSDVVGEIRILNSTMESVKNAIMTGNSSIQNLNFSEDKGSKKENVSITINVTNNGTDTTSEITQNSDVEKYKNLARQIENIVTKKIQDEKRVGGMLSRI